MASKAELVAFLRAIIRRRESTVVTILTDKRRPVLLRFSNGDLTHTHARSKDVNEAIKVLSETSAFRFSSSPGLAENRPPLMDALAFVDAIETGSGVPQVQSRAAPAASTTQTENLDDLIPGLSDALKEADRLDNSDTFEIQERRQQLEELAFNHLGPLAPIIVEEAMASANDLDAQIEYIAQQIPDDNAATAFREAAKS